MDQWRSLVPELAPFTVDPGGGDPCDFAPDDPEGTRIDTLQWHAEAVAGLEPASQQTRGVPDCGLDPVSHLDVTHELVRLALGWAWNELPAKYLIDLEAAADEGLPPPDDDDRLRRGRGPGGPATGGMKP